MLFSKIIDDDDDDDVSLLFLLLFKHRVMLSVIFQTLSANTESMSARSTLHLKNSEMSRGGTKNLDGKYGKKGSEKYDQQKKESYGQV